MVVLEPLLVVVDSGQEQIPVFGFLEQCLTVLAARQLCRKVATDLRGDRSDKGGAGKEGSREEDRRDGSGEAGDGEHGSRDEDGREEGSRDQDGGEEESWGEVGREEDRLGEGASDEGSGE
ncbi:hypothetical protein ACNJ7E_03120 [Rhodococcus sp. NM-2]|uniref:hypothetical protein n=1 Tax=Rhodococcus sp. NM-2 TaxID=3401174 RepID=UPI003AAC4C67